MPIPLPAVPPPLRFGIAGQIIGNAIRVTSLIGPNMNGKLKVRLPIEGTCCDTEWLIGTVIEEKA